MTGYSRLQQKLQIVTGHQLQSFGCADIPTNTTHTHAAAARFKASGQWKGNRWAEECMCLCHEADRHTDIHADIDTSLLSVCAHVCLPVCLLLVCLIACLSVSCVPDKPTPIARGAARHTDGHAHIQTTCEHEASVWVMPWAFECPQTTIQSYLQGSALLPCPGP